MADDGQIHQQPKVDLRWYAVRVPPQKERVAVSILQKESLIADFPTEERLRRATRYDPERKPVRFPACPGYLFVAWPGSDPIPWRKVFRIHLFKSVVSVNGAPARLNSQIVERLLNFEASTAPSYYKYLRTGREFAIGDTVTIMHGVFKDFELPVADITRGEARFLVPLLGQMQEVTVPIDHCYKAA